MDYKDWLLEQLKETYTNSNISQDGTFINMVDIPYKGIVIKHSDGLYISFKRFDLVDFSALAVYLEARLQKDGIRVYCKKADKSIWVYFDKTFSEGNRGAFEKAMWIFKILQTLITDITKVVERVAN